MILNVYSLKDELTGFGLPTVHDNDRVAMRSLQLAFEQPEPNIFRSNPSDYTLYCIGQFDTEVGLISSNATPRRVCSMSDFRKE